MKKTENSGMIDLEGWSESLLNALPLSEGERKLLQPSIQRDCRNILSPSRFPEELRKTLGNPLEDARSLKDQCAELAGFLHRGDLPAWLKDLARVLDTANRPESGVPFRLYGCWPGMFCVDGEGKLAVIGQGFDFTSVREGSSQNSFFRDPVLRNRLHPDIAKNLSRVDPSAAVLYSFAVFLAESLMEVRANFRDDLIREVDHIRLRKPDLPPPLPGLLSRILSLSVQGKPEMTCQNLLEQVRVIFAGCARPETAAALDGKHEFKGESLTGRVKQKNEDQFLVKGFEECPGLSLLVVADGISTASIGSGWWAANKVPQEFELSWLPDFRARARRWSEKRTTLVPTEWEQEAGAELERFFRICHEAIVEKTNEFWKKQEFPRQNPGPESHAPMATTLTAALVFGTCAVIMAAGDSPAFLYSQRSGWGLAQLTVPQNREAENPSSGDLEDGKALTMAVGLCAFDAAKDRWVPVPLELQRYFLSLKAGELLILGSDGLVECIAGPEPSGKMMEQTVQNCLQTGLDLPRLVKTLMRLAEDGTSHDNITCCALRLVQDEKEETNGRRTRSHS